MMLWAADEGPWTRITWKAGQTGLTATTSSTFNNLNGNYWGTIYAWNDNGGIGYTIDGGSSVASTKIGVFSIYERQESVPSYTRKVLTWTFQVGSLSKRHHSNTALYSYNGSSNDIKSINVDFTYNYQNKAGSGYLAGQYTNQTSDNQGHYTNNITKTFEFDNRSGISEATKYWSLLLTHVIGSGASGVTDTHEWAGFLSKSESWSTYYYKYVSFNGNGSTSGSMSTQTIENSGTLKANAFSRTGYTFAGWATTPNGSQAYASQATINATSTSKGPVTLYARWTANTYTVTFDKQSGTGGSNSVTATYGSAMPSMTIPTRTGYTFGGYYTGTDGSGTQYYNASGASVRNWDRTSNTTLYAKWTLNTYSVSYNANGGSGAPSSQTKTHGTNLTLRDKGSLSRTGYTTDGWATSAGGNKAYNFGGTYSNNAAITLYAHWNANTYKVKFNGNGSTSGSMSDQNFTYGTAQNLTANGFSRTGYTFAGWATSAGGDKVYNNQQSVNNLTATNGGTFNLYAKWDVVNYTISYELDGGSVASENPTSYNIESAAITLNNPTKDGYTFAGWTGTDLGAATTSVTIAHGSTGNRSYTATWTQNTATLTDVDVLSALSAWAGKTCTVTYTREFTADKPSTVCLPFAYTPQGEEKFYSFTGINEDGGNYTADMTEVVPPLVANTPYLFMPTGDADFSGTYAIPSTIAAVTTTSGDWTFKGTYSTIEWTDAPAEPTYGFSAQDANAGITQGQFVKVGSYVRIKPMRAYLQYNGSDSQFINARSLTRAAATTSDDTLPETIGVRLISANGEVTGIGSISTKTGEVTLDKGAWYSLEGKRFASKPSQKGIYVNNGKKVVIK